MTKSLKRKQPAAPPLRRRPSLEDLGGIRAVLVKLNPEGWRSLRFLAIEKDTSLQALGIEALNDLLKKYGKPPVVESPRS